METYLLSVGGELGRLSAAADGLVRSLDSRTDQLLNGTDDGVDLLKGID